MDEIDVKSVLNEKTTVLNVPPFANKDELFDRLSTVLFDAGCITSKEKYLESLNFRENEGPTCMGGGIAIPHGKCVEVIKPAVCVCKTTDKFKYESFQESDDVDLIFMLAIPGSDNTNMHIKMLAALARMLVHEDVVKKLRNANTFADVLDAFSNND